MQRFSSNSLAKLGTKRSRRRIRISISIRGPGPAPPPRASPRTTRATAVRPAATARGLPKVAHRRGMSEPLPAWGLARGRRRAGPWARPCCGRALCLRRRARPWPTWPSPSASAGRVGHSRRPHRRDDAAGSRSRQTPRHSIRCMQTRTRAAALPAGPLAAGRRSRPWRRRQIRATGEHRCSGPWALDWQRVW